MSMKKLKQQVATALIVAMTATNVLSAFAAGGVGQPSTMREVAVTFNSGAGYFETASKSSVATFSNAKKTELTQDENKIATQSSITRTFKMDGEEFDAYVESEQLFKNEDGCYYVNLEEADHWFAELAADETNLQPEMLKIEENLGLNFAGWYDNSGTVPKVLGAKEEIYNGAVLDAGWKYPQNLPSTVDKAFDDLVAVGMPQDAKLELNEVKEEDQKEYAELTEKLVQINAAVKPGENVYELVKDTPIVPIDIKIENFNSADLTGDKKFVTVVLPVPDDLKDVDKEAGERIIAIHFAEKDTYIIPVEVDPDTGNMSFALDLTQGFSPFFFVKVKASEKEPDVEKVKVKVTGSDDGYIAAWTEDETTDEYSVIYLPVNEEVELDKGTMLYYDGIAHGNKYCESYTITNTETSSKEVVRGSHQLILENSCEIAPTFKEYDFGDNDYEDEGYIDAWLEPTLVTTEGRYNGVISVEEWDATAKEFKTVTGAKLRIPTEEDADRWPWLSDRENDWNLFNYVAETNEVKSKDELKLGWYDLPMILTYEEQEQVVYLFVEIGAGMSFVPGLFQYDGKIVVENEFDEIPNYGFRRFNYTNGDNWSKIEELLKTMPIDFTPQMYNYKFAGWQTLDCAEYESSTRLVPENRDDFYFYAVARFEKDGKPYIGKEEGSNQGGNNNNGGGSSSSGGGSRRHVIGGSSSTITSMTGTWTMGENGWKFLKTNGEYAVNTWGYINNQWYYFNEAGDMVTGWMFINGRWYYLNPAEGSFQGAMLTGVIFDPFYNAYFYADANGAMVTGWYQVADKWYYFNPISDGRQGALFADTVIDGYYVGADGAWVPGN